MTDAENKLCQAVERCFDEGYGHDATRKRCGDLFDRVDEESGLYRAVYIFEESYDNCKRRFQAMNPFRTDFDQRGRGYCRLLNLFFAKNPQ